MTFLTRFIRIIWWATSFAAANVSWFLVAQISLKGVPLAEDILPYFDNVFFVSIGLIVLAALFALWATIDGREARRPFFAKAWFTYLGLYLLCAAGAYLLQPAIGAA